MKRIIDALQVISLGSVLIATAANANSSQNLSIDSLLKTIESNPEVRLQKSIAESKASRLEIVKDNALPTVQFSGNGDLVNTATDRRTIDASVEKTIFDWGSNQSAVESAESGLEAERANAEATRVKIAKAVVQNYILAVSSFRKSLSIDAAIEESVKLKLMMQRRVEQRVNPASDLLLVESRLGQLESSRLQFQGQERDAQLSLLQLTDHKARVDDDLRCTADLDEAFLVRRATEQAPELAAARLESVSVKSKFGAVEAKRYPALVAGVGVSHDIDSSEDDARAYLTFRYNFDIGDRIDTELEELRAQHASAVFEEQRVANAIVREAAGYVNQYRVNSNQVPLADALTELRNEQLESHVRRFSSGKSSWLDLINAQQELTDARLLAIDVAANACLAVLNLEQMTARLLRD